ncbi:16202_t:CDS:2 [Gigaspora rosea]|nr:16202_t:CDS:2 [Gigaspora rosea]
MLDFSLPEQNWEQVVSKMLKDAINESFHSGYHQVPYTANELYFIRHKNESRIPSPRCWDKNSEISYGPLDETYKHTTEDRIKLDESGETPGERRNPRRNSR